MLKVLLLFLILCTDLFLCRFTNKSDSSNCCSTRVYFANANSIGGSGGYIRSETLKDS